VTKRKTYTSPEVKNRWNSKHYDRMAVVIPKGSRDEINAAAQRRGMSTSAYVRSLLLRDMQANGDISTNLAGGGSLNAGSGQSSSESDTKRSAI